MTDLRALSLVALSSLALAACSRGTVAVELTDAVPSLSTIERVDVTLGAVDVYVDRSCNDGDDEDARKSDDDDRGEWVTVTDRAGTFDLMSLRDDVTAPLGEVDVRGEVTRIRLQIDTAGENRVVLDDGQVCAVDLRAVDPGGTEISHDFEPIDPSHGGRATVVVDFVLEESLTQEGACSFRLDPVLKIKRVEESDGD